MSQNNMITKQDYGHWILPPNILSIPTLAVGFVYQITNTLTNRKYIGKKILLHKKTKKPLKGKINKRRSVEESDWRTYCGSSKILLVDISTHGEDKFTFQILSFFNSKVELSYGETKEIILRDAIFSIGYYNEFLYTKLRNKKTHIHSL